MARTSTITPYKSTITKTERTARRLTKQTKKLEQEILIDMNVKVLPNSGKMVKYSDIKKIQPLTDTQEFFFEEWNNNTADAYILYGSAGTGKSLLALYVALKEILSTESVHKKLIIIRSAVATRDLGHLKGTLEEKVKVYEEPYINLCTELTNNKYAYEKLKETNKIEFVSSSYLRGLSFNECIVIVEECQSMNWHELNTIMCRLGKQSKIICTGDMVQNDLLKSRTDVSGFKELLSVSRTMESFRSFKFTSDDILRSEFVKAWIIGCEKLGL